MTNLNATINVNVDKKLKEDASAILKDLGLNMSTFINMALAQVVKRNGVPFRITNPKPSKEMLEALKEAEKIASGKVDVKGYKYVDELFKDLDNDD